jgi:hypothetical protein
MNIPVLITRSSASSPAGRRLGWKVIQGACRVGIILCLLASVCVSPVVFSLFWAEQGGFQNRMTIVMLWVLSVAFAACGFLILRVASDPELMHATASRLWQSKRKAGVLLFLNLVASVALASVAAPGNIARLRLGLVVFVLIGAAEVTPGVIQTEPVWVRSLFNRRHLLRFAALAAVVVLFVFAGIKFYISERNQVDILGSLDRSAPIYQRVSEARSRSGDRAALEVLALYLLERPARPRVVPWQVWLESPEDIRAAANLFRSGDIGAGCPGPSYFWRPGQPVTWNGPSTDMLVFCLQRQTFLIYVLADPQAGNDRATLDAAWSLTQDWRQSNPIFPVRYPWVWNDDVASNRIMAQMGLGAARRKLGLATPDDELVLVRTVLQHAAVLMDESRHNYSTNHGLMQNCALLAIALEYPEFDRNHAWLNTAIRRTERHMRETVSADGPFLERTPHYHWMATAMNLWFVATCRQAHVDLEPWVEERARKMAAFTRSILQPDRSFPAIADTRLSQVSGANVSWADLPDWPEVAALRQALSPGPILPNIPGVQIWPDAGYFVLRAPAPAWDQDSALMATMIAGPRTLAHEHFNALSLTLYANGRPLLEGPGYLGYFDPKRDVALATISQNTVSEDWQSQQPGATTIRHFEVLSSKEGDPPRQVAFQAESSLYPGTLHRRSLFYGVSPTAILLIDELTSGVSHVYRQHFRLAPGIAADGRPGVLSATAGSRPVLRIRTWILTPRGLSPAALDLDDFPVVSFALVDRNATFISVLDAGGSDS